MSYIYESPDGGKTVYKRKAGEVDKQLHSISDEIKQMRLSAEWQQIRERAREDAGLQEMVDQITVYYRLKYEQ